MKLFFWPFFWKYSKKLDPNPKLSLPWDFQQHRKSARGLFLGVYPRPPACPCIPFRPVVHLTGRVVLTRDPQSGLITAYREFWDQSILEVLASVKF